MTHALAVAQLVLVAMMIAAFSADGSEDHGIGRVLAVISGAVALVLPVAVVL